MMPWGLVYRIVGGFLVFAACAMIGSSLFLVFAGPDAEGWDSFAAAIGGLVVGGAVGSVAGAVFAFLRPPEDVRTRWLVLGGIFLLAAVAMTILEFLD